MQEEPIPDELLANIPVVGDESTTVFVAVEAEDEDDVLVTPAPMAPQAEEVVLETKMADESAGPALAAQLRYDMGEAFARELDKAEASIAGAIGDLEKRLSQAEAALIRAHEAANREREAREQAEARLRAFKDLALR